MNKILELRVANIAIYVDVPDATVGAIPNSKNNGVNRTPPLSPTAPEIKPAMIAKIMNFVIDF